MVNCTECGQEVRPGEIFCRHCGARLAPEQAASGSASGASGAGAGEEDLAMFVGKNSDTYLRKFKKFTRSGEDAFAATWHWPAFLFTFWWLIYRKMYGWAILALVLGLVPCVGFLTTIGFGVSANYLYYRHAKKKMLELRAAPGPEIERAAAIGRAGGVNNVAIILVPAAVVILAILAAIAIPQFVTYRQRAADVQAKHEIQEACRIGEKIFAEDLRKESIEPDELLYAGLVRTPDVEMTLLDGRRENFSITAKHKQGKILYRTNRQCVLAEEQQAR